jgi:hypothetical protein
MLDLAELLEASKKALDVAEQVAGDELGSLAAVERSLIVTALAELIRETRRANELQERTNELLEMAAHQRALERA